MQRLAFLTANHLPLVLNKRPVIKQRFKLGHQLPDH
jgi:hypothetical protein